MKIYLMFTLFLFGCFVLLRNVVLRPRLALSLPFICCRFIVCGTLGNIVLLAAAQYNHKPAMLASEPPLGG